MPISSFSIVSLIALELNAIRPKDYEKPQVKELRILDVGIGSGFYGAVARQFIDLGYRDKTTLVGVEPYTDYQNPNWAHYQMVFRKTIQDFLAFDRSRRYDCILFLDVIEHFKRIEGLSILEQLMTKLLPGGVLLVSTPGEFQEQGNVNGNDLERHLSFFETEDFTSRDFVLLKDGKRRDEFLQCMTVVKYVNKKE